MKNKKSPILMVLYILTAVFVVWWSVWKYSLGVNKNFFFGQFAVIGVIYLLFSIAIKMNRKLRAEKIDIALEDGEYAKAALLMDEYISEESVPDQTYLGRSFIALLQNDSECIENLLGFYGKEITDADKAVMETLLAAISAKTGDTVFANQKADAVDYDFSALINKDFYLSLVADVKDYISAITAISQERKKEAEKIMQKREKHTLAGAYEGIMDLLWENLREGKIYKLPKMKAENTKKSGISKVPRTIAFYILAVMVMLVPSDFNFKDSYDSLWQLNDRINFFNEVVCAYGNDKIYYLKYYDFEGNYVDQVYEVVDGKYNLLTGEERDERYMKGNVGGRDIKISLFSKPEREVSVIVIEEITDMTPSASALYNGKPAFAVPLSPFDSKDLFYYTAFMGIYDGHLQDVVVEFDWGSVDIYDLN